MGLLVQLKREGSVKITGQGKESDLETKKFIMHWLPIGTYLQTLLNKVFFLLIIKF
jgi:hypothetical protein